MLYSIAISYNDLAKPKTDVSIPLDTSANESSLNESTSELMEVFIISDLLISSCQVLREVLQTQLN